MYNDYIIRIASQLFTERIRYSSLYMNRDDVLKDKEQVERHADTCLTLAELFFDRAKTILPPEKPFELLDPADYEKS